MEKTIDWEKIKEKLGSGGQGGVSLSFETNLERVDKIFGERAKKLAERRQEAKDFSATLPILTFYLGKERYGFEVAQMKEVVSLATITPLPLTAPEFYGVVNLRGDVRAVVDLARILNLSDREDTLPAYILFPQEKMSELGLKVDQVDKVEFIGQSQLKKYEQGQTGPSGPYVKGICSGSNIILLDLNAIISHKVFNHH